MSREIRADIDFPGNDLRVLGNEQDIVEGQGSGEVGAYGKLGPRFHIHVSGPPAGLKACTTYRGPSPRQSMTLLVFLAAAARARIVAADFRFVAPNGLHGGIVATDARR